MPRLDEHARSQAILSALGATGRVQVNDLAQRLAVSTVTIGTDLDALEQAGTRVHRVAVRQEHR